MSVVSQPQTSMSLAWGRLRVRDDWHFRLLWRHWSLFGRQNKFLSRAFSGRCNRRYLVEATSWFIIEAVSVLVVKNYSTRNKYWSLTHCSWIEYRYRKVESIKLKYSGVKTFTHSVEGITVESHNILLFCRSVLTLLPCLYVISILTLHNQIIDFAKAQFRRRASAVPN